MRHRFSLVALIVLLASSLTFAQSAITESNGNVGIGTATPTAKLEIQPAVDGNTQLRLDQPNWQGGFGFTVKNDGHLYVDRYGTPIMTMQMSGNVGIGTVTPSQKLTIGSGSASFDNFGFASSYRSPANNFTNLFLGGAIVDNGNGSYTVQTDGGSNYFGAIRMDNSGGNAGAINFYTGKSISGSSYTLTNTQLANYLRMSIVDQNVGVGTAGPQSYFHGGTNRVIEIYNPATAANSQSHVILSTGATSNLGGVGSVTWTAPNSPGNKGVAYVGAAITEWDGTNVSGDLVFATANRFTPLERFRITANGNIKLSGGSIIFGDGTVQSTAWAGSLCGGDYAESVDVSGDRAAYEPGDLLVIDPRTPGNFIKSFEPYSTTITGVYSTKPGVVGRRQPTDKAQSKTEVPMAMIGIVPAKVSAENGSIHPGDILVSSSTPGHAMKGTDRSLFAGAVVGKALGSLESGTGVIEVVVSLQ